MSKCGYSRTCDGSYEGAIKHDCCGCEVDDVQEAAEWKHTHAAFIYFDCGLRAWQLFTSIEDADDFVRPFYSWGNVNRINVEKI